MMRQMAIGQKVVYTRDKYTSSPGRRAKNIIASKNGESYEYQVDKYWLVADVLPNNQVVLVTRRGKRHLVSNNDPRLRSANFFERIVKAHLFPSVASLRCENASAAN